MASKFSCLCHHLFSKLHLKKFFWVDFTSAKRNIKHFFKGTNKSIVTLTFAAGLIITARLLQYLKATWNRQYISYVASFWLLLITAPKATSLDLSSKQVLIITIRFKFQSVGSKVLTENNILNLYSFLRNISSREKLRRCKITKMLLDLQFGEKFRSEKILERCRIIFISVMGCGIDHFETLIKRRAQNFVVQAVHP